MEEIEKPYSRWQWFFYIILVPIIFGLLLGGMIFTFLGYDVLDTAKSIGSNIPGISKLLDQSDSTNGGQNSIADSGSENNGDGERSDSAAEDDPQLQALQQQLEEKEAEIERLMAELKQREEIEEQERISKEEYQQNLRELARVYGGMSASRAAEIFENMTLMEAAQIMVLMSQQQQTSIFSKLEPTFAAQLTVLMKELHLVDDPDMAALQERVQVLANALDEKDADAKLSLNQLAKTYANLPPDHAATIFEQMSGNEEDFQLALKILAVMSDQDRSNLMAAMDTEKARTYTRALAKKSEES